MNGLITKSLEIHKLLVDYEVDVAMLQELRMQGSPRMPSFPVYKIFRRTCPVREFREIAILVREPLQARVKGRSPGKQSTDSLAMEVVFEGIHPDQCIRPSEDGSDPGLRSGCHFPNDYRR